MPWVPSSSARHRASQQASGLPVGFVSISDILDETVRAGNSTNVVGLVKDCRLPIPTRGTDYKTALVLYDLSTQDSNEGIHFNIFCPQEEMPEVKPGDVVMVFQAKVQRFRSNPLSLITSFRTSVHVFSASRILKPPRSAKAALLPPKKKNSNREPNEKEYEYVSYFYHQIDKYGVPDEEQFQIMAKQSLNIKQKFSLLQDVQEGKFCDLFVQVVRDPFDLGDKTTLYVSDYTENDFFFNYTWEGVRDLSSGEGYAYEDSSQQASTKKEWIGPYGKKAMQITCYEPHASYIRHEAKAGSWLGLQNVQVKLGRDGRNLEGFMREDRSAFGDSSAKINAHVLDTTDRDTIDPRLKDAIRRWRDYTRVKKADLKRLESTELKRKSEEPEKKRLNAKQRRKRRREEVEKKVDEQASKEEQSLGLNQLISSESVEKPTCAVESILEPAFYETLINGEPKSLLLPFTCSKYRANTRVVDFRPNCLEDFACVRKQTAFDVLSDHSGDSDSGEEEDDDDMGMGRLVWEWRFMLQLEDASAKDKARNRIWVVVDNAEAQYLTGLDASNLRQDPETLAKLRERLFALWGDLEEHKARKAAEQAATIWRKPGDMPPMESSDAEDDGPRRGRRERGGEAAAAVSNKPFTCCIKQYGVRVREDDPALASAGNGRRWERVFGLFGTKICC